MAQTREEEKGKPVLEAEGQGVRWASGKSEKAHRRQNTQASVGRSVV